MGKPDSPGLGMVSTVQVDRLFARITRHDDVLSEIKKGVDRAGQIEAGRLLNKTDIENSVYVISGIAGKALSREHAEATASALNQIAPQYVRLRTFVPKINTSLLRKVEKGDFIMAEAHEVLRETKILLENLTISTSLKSDHYTNYINLKGELPMDKQRLLQEIDHALKRDESTFRPFFIGNQ